MLSYLPGLDWNLKPDSATVNIHVKWRSREGRDGATVYVGGRECG